MRAAACQAAPGAPAPYERRRPEETTLYQVVQDHVETFLAQVEQETGTGLPQFVKDEFDAFLQCGMLDSQTNFRRTGKPPCRASHPRMAP